MASASHPRWRQSRQIDDLAEAMPDRVTLARNARDRRAMRGARRAAASRSENDSGPSRWCAFSIGSARPRVTCGRALRLLLYQRDEKLAEELGRSVPPPGTTVPACGSGP